MPAIAVKSSRRRPVLIAALCMLFFTASSPIATSLLPDTNVGARLGTTFSPYEAEARGLDYQEAFERVLAAPRMNVIRIGSYWSEVEANGWERLDWLVEQAVANDKQIVLTVGIKSPRWPEYWMPERLGIDEAPDWSRLDEIAPWLRAEALDFITEAVMRYRNTPGLLAWQVENEPLDPSGQHMWSLSDDLLAAEVEIVRILDPERPIALTFYMPISMQCDLAHLSDCAMLFASLFPRSGDRLLDLLRPGDILGVDIYTSIGSAYSNGGWERDLRDWQNKAREDGVELWVTEAQAEPWPTATSGVRNSQIVTADRSVNLMRTLSAAGVQTILLWGSEHWLASEEQNPDWVRNFLQ